jgi:hypothetical protein
MQSGFSTLGKAGTAAGGAFESELTDYFSPESIQARRIERASRRAARNGNVVDDAGVNMQNYG